MNSSLLIKNGIVVSSVSALRADVLIENGKISQVAPMLQVEAERVIDASGLHILPGVLDPQVHFREPGLTHKEDLHTGSMAAAAGGVTSFFDMPNNKPAITTRTLMAEKKKRAAEQCVVNYNFFIGATPSNLDELNETPNVCGIKIFMGSSTGDLLVERQDSLENIFAHGSRLIAVHAEDNAVISSQKAKYPNAGFSDHPNIRNAEAALTATRRAVNLALKYERRLHILHVTTEEEVVFLARYKSNPLISAEVCPQHLILSAPEIYEKLGALAQMNPPLREARHGKALWQGLHDGVIKCMATDHAPHTLEEKKLPYGEAPSGMPGVETLLPIMLDQASRGLCSLQDVVRWTGENPYKLYGVKNKGAVSAGYDADLVLVDLNLEKEVCRENLWTKVRWSPYEGMRLRGWPRYTLVRGHVVFNDGVMDEAFRGEEILLKS